MSQFFSALYLASDSPARQALLKQMGIDFTVVSHGVDEQRLASESAEKMVERLALAKAQDVQQRLPDCSPHFVLGADTVVVAGEEILGKPVDQADGLRMLELLSGQTHRVLTAVALVAPDHVAVRVNINEVSFTALTPQQRLAYWQTGEPEGKAGAYAVQGRAGIFIERIEGSFSGIMGLPLFETYQLLQEMASVGA